MVKSTGYPSSECTSDTFWSFIKCLHMFSIFVLRFLPNFFLIEIGENSERNYCIQ